MGAGKAGQTTNVHQTLQRTASAINQTLNNEFKAAGLTPALSPQSDGAERGVVGRLSCDPRS